MVGENYFSIQFRFIKFNNRFTVEAILTCLLWTPLHLTWSPQQIPATLILLFRKKSKLFRETWTHAELDCMEFGPLAGLQFNFSPVFHADSGTSLYCFTSCTSLFLPPILSFASGKIKQHQRNAVLWNLGVLNICEREWMNFSGQKTRSQGNILWWVPPPPTKTVTRKEIRLNVLQF